MMLGKFFSMTGETIGSMAQSLGADKVLKKATTFIDTNFRDPNLISNIETMLKTKYGEEEIYNDFDAYLKEFKIFSDLIETFYNIGSRTVPSQKGFVEEHLKKFSSLHKKYDVYQLSFVKEGFDLIYTEVLNKLVVLDPHTDIGKLQIYGAIFAAQNHDEYGVLNNKIDQVLTILQASQNGINNLTRDDVGPVSETIDAFLRKIDSIGTCQNPVSSDEEAIIKYQELSTEALTTLFGENVAQVNLVICSLQCHLAIHHSNLGQIDKAFQCLEKVPSDAAKKSKLYHFVTAVIIVNHGIEEKYDMASTSVNRALELDENYHRAFLVGQYLSALRKADSLEAILTALDSRFASILAENSDCNLIADYYIYRGFICKEFVEFDSAEQAFIKAKEFGYDELVSDYNIGLLYYTRATQNVPKNTRVFCAKVDTSLLIKTIDLFKPWLFDRAGSIPVFIKSRMVGLYASACSIIGIKHDLKPIEQYIKLPNLEYEVQRILAFGTDQQIGDEIVGLLAPEDQLYAQIVNCVNADRYSDIPSIFANMTDEQLSAQPTPTIFMILQACIIIKDVDGYQRYRSFIKPTDEIDQIECFDAYMLEQEGNIEKAKEILDKYAFSSVDYHLLSNILRFYARNNFDAEREKLFLYLLNSSLEKRLFIDDKLELYEKAIHFFISQKSNHAKRFVDDIQEDTVLAWRLKAYFYESIGDIHNLLFAISELANKDQSKYLEHTKNKCICLLKLMRYEDALMEAKTLLETVHENNIKDRSQIMWIISNAYLYMGDESNSIDWANKAHELTADIPADKSHQAYFARAIRTGRFDDSLGDILEYKKKHPIAIDWLKEFKIPEDASGETFIKTLNEITGHSHEKYVQREKEFLSYYNSDVSFPNSLMLKHCGDNLDSFFNIFQKNKLWISSGNLKYLAGSKKMIGEHIIVDTLTLIVLYRYGCLEALKKIRNIHICYSTLARMQDYYQTSNAGYVEKLLGWIRQAPNIVWESDGYLNDSYVSNVFQNDFLSSCRAASEKNIPLLTLETSMEQIALLDEPKTFNNLQIVSIVSLCYATMEQEPEKLSKMLYELLKDCTFISFTAETIYEQIKANDFIIDENMLSRFFICKSSYDMLSFENVYVATIKLLLEDHPDSAVAFAALVVNNAETIWRKGTYYRHLQAQWQDPEAIAKTKAITQYELCLFYHLKNVFSNNLPSQIQQQCESILKNVIRELGREYVAEIIDSLKSI